MNGKTNSGSYLSWIIALLIAIIILMLIGFLSVEWLIIDPVKQALIISTLVSINEFSGAVEADPFWMRRLPALAGMLLFFVVGPVFWLNGKISDQEKPDASWYAGLSLILIGIIFVGLSLISLRPSTIVKDNNESAAQSRATDAIRSELATIYNKAAELYWLPTEKGGAGQNFNTVSANGQLRTVTLNDLINKLEFKSTFVIKKPVADSVLTIYGIGNMQGDDPNFENADGRQGKIQLGIEINPKQLSSNWLNTSSLKN